MNQVQNQQTSIYTQSRTQKSPGKQALGLNYRSSKNQIQQLNIQLQYARLKQQSKKQLQILLKQNQELRDEIYRKNQQIEHLKQTVIVNLKKDLNDIQKESIKNFKQNQKKSREIQKLIQDNKNMQKTIQKSNRQKKQYYNKLDELKQIKETTKKQILEKDKIIKIYLDNNKKLQKEIMELNINNQDLNQEKNIIQKKLFQSQSEYKSVLQKGFVMETQLRTLQLRQRDNELMLNNYIEKIKQNQIEREQFIQRINEQDSRNQLSQTNRGNMEQIQMIQIKALMDKIYALVDDKKQESKHAQKKFLASILCLERVLPKK